MRSASAATLAILAGGKYLLAQLYDITLSTGQVYHFTDFQIPLTASIYAPAAGPFTYQTGLTITRDTITVKTGMNGGTMKLVLTPQADSPNAPVLINGYPFLQACRLGFFDGATIQMSKLFMNVPAPGAAVDTSPGAVGWFLGTAEDVQAGRFSAEISVDDYLALLGVQQMPRQLFGVGCYHQVYDAGCTLLKSAFTSTGTVSTVTDGAHFTTNLTQADDYFDLGVITFTSGANSGFSANVSSFKNASGAIVTNYPFPRAPAVGDAFSIYPGCDLQQATCSGKFANLAHFGGQPYIPVPETILDGGASAPAAQTRGAQAGQLIGSAPSAQQTYGGYKA
jgi:uncharacterized phage protein (TIGR02218 family)